VSRRAQLADGAFGTDLTQAAEVCSFTLNASSLGISPQGGIVLAPMTASNSACDPTAGTAADWIRVQVQGSQVYLHVSTNSIPQSSQPGPSNLRSAFVFVNNQSLLVSQSGQGLPPGGCTFQASSMPATIGADGTNGTPLTQTVTTNLSSCAWSAVPFTSGLALRPFSSVGSGPVYWSVYPNFSSSPRTLNAVVAGTPVTITQAGAAESESFRFIRLAYFSLLGRLPSTQELQTQSGLLAQTTRTAFVNSMMNSAEFNLTTRFVAGLYLGLLERDAEYAGYQFQREALRLGIATVPSLVTNFLNSEEYALHYGNLTNDAFVRALYRTILLRVPTDPEVSAQVLNLNSTTRSTMAYGFLQSPEFYRGNGSRLTTFLLYGTLLFRDPGGIERLNMLGRLDRSVTRATLIDDLLSSAEFRNLLN